MNTKVNFRFARYAETILIVLVLSILIFVSGHSQVQSQIGGDDPLLPQKDAGTQAVITGDGVVPGGPGFVMISPLSFKPYALDDEWAYTMGYLYNPGTSQVSTLTAGLTLPHGATLTKVTLYYKDAVAGSVELRLFQGTSAEGASVLADIHTSESLPTYRYLSTTEIMNPIVDNQNYSYFIAVYLPNNAGTNALLTNARIDYEYPGYLPCIQK